MSLFNCQAQIFVFRALRAVGPTGRKAKTPRPQRVINRRSTQMGTDKEFFKTLTAETQSTLRQEFLPNRETTIGQKTSSLEEACFCLSSSPDKQKMNFSAPSAPLR